MIRASVEEIGHEFIANPVGVDNVDITAIVAAAEAIEHTVAKKTETCLAGTGICVPETWGWRIRPLLRREHVLVIGEMSRYDFG